MANITWNTADFTWDVNSFTWDEVQLVQEIRAGGVIEDDMPWMKPKKKEQLIKLILKVKGETLTESKRKQIKQYKIKVNDIKLAIKNISNIELMTENIKF